MVSDKPSRFTSDRRPPSRSSWADDADWNAGGGEGVEVVGGELVGRDLERHSEIPGSSIDDFEANLYENKSKTLSDYYAGHLSKFSRQQGTVQSGSHALQAVSDGNTYPIISTSGLNHPQRGDTFEIYYYAGTTGEPQMSVVWAAQDAANFYSLEINNDSPDDVLYLKKDGSTLASTGSGDSTPRSEWQRVVIDWQSTITCELHNSNGSPDYSVSAPDTEYSSGGVGFIAGASGSGKSYWDSFWII